MYYISLRFKDLILPILKCLIVNNNVCFERYLFLFVVPTVICKRYIYGNTIHSTININCKLSNITHSLFKMPHVWHHLEEHHHLWADHMIYPHLLSRSYDIPPPYEPIIWYTTTLWADHMIYPFTAYYIYSLYLYCWQKAEPLCHKENNEKGVT